jgi:hypothetical protein
MATCGSCGKEIRDNDWTCGSCGAPVGGAGAAAGSGASPSGYASGYEEPPAAYGAPETYGAPAVYGAPAAAPAATGGLSRTTRNVIIVAAVAIVAIIAVWFFVLRGGSSPFDGTWNASSSSIGAIVISGSGSDFKVKTTATDSSGAQKSSVVPAHLDGADLVITVDDFVKATGDQAQAAQVKAIFEALIKDFRLVFSLQDSTHLKLTVEGTPTSGQSPSQGQQSIVLVKAP